MSVELTKLSITNNSLISAIYYALLQCGYDFYAIERDAFMVKKLQSFIMPDNNEYGFFQKSGKALVKFIRIGQELLC